MKKVEKDRKDIIPYVMIGIVLVVLVWSLYTYATTDIFGLDYQTALNAENSSDKCATPAGYTDQSWREHMSHHPDRYAECLGK